MQSHRRAQIVILARIEKKTITIDPSSTRQLVLDTEETEVGICQDCGNFSECLRLDDIGLLRCEHCYIEKTRIS